MYKTWKVIDLHFNAIFKGNAYTEVTFTANIILKDNLKETRQTVNGFYNGDNDFVLRMCMDEIGDYSYITKSNISDLDGLTGNFTVIQNDNDHCHGPIVLNKQNKQRLFYMDGTPYNLCAFECDWLFALSYDDKTEMKKTRSLIKQISENGFNQVVMNVYANDILWEEDCWIKDELLKTQYDYGNRKDIFPFLGNNDNPDYSELNPEFFKHLDNVISILNEYGIVAHLMIYVWNKKVNWPKPLSKADNMYFNHIIKRYQAYPNLIWDISKEALLYGHDTSYIEERIHRCRSLSNFKRLITVHDYSFCSKNHNLVDFISVQSWVLDIYNEMMKISKKFSDKVVVNIEHGGYEKSPYTVFNGNYIEPKVCLRRNYEILFAGVYSTYYWQATSWNVMMMPNKANPTPCFKYYKYMNEFFIKYKFDNLIPTQQYGKSGRFMINKKENMLIVYIRKENYSVGINNIEKYKGNNCDMQYFNTITGEYSIKQQYRVKDFNHFVSPYKDDSILILHIKEDKN